MRVCLIESGGLDPLHAITDSNVAERLGMPVDLAKFRRHTFGGASNWWGGKRGRWFRMKPMDPIDFAVRPWIPNSGWPLEYGEVARYFQRAAPFSTVPAVSRLTPIALSWPRNPMMTSCKRQSCKAADPGVLASIIGGFNRNAAESPRRLPASRPRRRRAGRGQEVSGDPSKRPDSRLRNLSAALMITSRDSPTSSRRANWRRDAAIFGIS